MQLSEAIRLGSMLAPQAFGEHKAPDGRTCALGAAEAAGYSYDKLVRSYIRIDPILYQCPECHQPAPLVCMVIHLNDQHKWMREAIADWVATKEAAATVPAADPVSA